MILPVETNPLAYGFSRLNFLQSSGTQWIDTGIKPSQFDEFEIGYEVGQNARGNYFGVDNSVDDNYISNAITSYSTSRSNLWAAYGNREGCIGLAYGMPLIYRVDQQKAYFTYEGVTRTVEKDGEIVDVSMRLFRANGAATKSTYADSHLKIFYAKFQKNGEYLGYFIPMLDPYKRPCMFDVISQKPFYNEGTGEFLYG